jgi:two-component sensor histidine kinase
MHDVLNRLQMIMGTLDMAEAETDSEKRAQWFTKGRDYIRSLTVLLQEKVETKGSRKEK